MLKSGAGGQGPSARARSPVPRSGTVRVPMLPSFIFFIHSDIYIYIYLLPQNYGLPRIMGGYVHPRQFHHRHKNKTQMLGNGNVYFVAMSIPELLIPPPDKDQGEDTQVKKRQSNKPGTFAMYYPAITTKAIQTKCARCAHAESE